MRLVHGTDYRGRVCGVDAGVRDRKLTAYPRPGDDDLVNAALAKQGARHSSFYGICVDRCPRFRDVVCNDGVAESQAFLRRCMDVWPRPAGCENVTQSCWSTPVDTEAVFFRCLPLHQVEAQAQSRCVLPAGINDANDPRCVAREDVRNSTTLRPASESRLVRHLNSAAQRWGRYFADLHNTWWIILLCSVVLGSLLGFAWIMSMQYCAGVIVWAMLVGVLLLGAALSLYLFGEAGMVDQSVLPKALESRRPGVYNPALDEIQRADSGGVAYSVGAYLTGTLTGLLAIIIVALRRGVQTSVRVMRIGTEAISHTKSLVFLPFLTVLVLGCMMMWTLFASAALMSAGRETSESLQARVGDSALFAPYNLQVTEDLPAFHWLQIYNVLAGMWIFQWVLGMGVAVIAGAVGSWYFSQNPARLTKDELAVFKRGKWPLLAACWRAGRFHPGSVAFGSLVIAIIQAVRVALVYVDRKTREMQRRNALVRVCMLCVHCCMWFLHRAVQAVCREAYIFTAIKGEHFLRSGYSALHLIYRYQRLLAILNTVSSMILFLGKVFVAGLCALVAFVVVRHVPEMQPGEDLAVHAPWLVAAVTGAFAYMTASAYFDVYDIAIDTVLLCHVIDVDETRAQGGKAIPRHRPSSDLTKLADRARKEIVEDDEGRRGDRKI